MGSSSLIAVYRPLPFRFTFSTQHLAPSTQYLAPSTRLYSVLRPESYFSPITCHGLSLVTIVTPSRRHGFSRLATAGVRHMLTVWRELYGAMVHEKATKGIIAISGEFTQEARGFARVKTVMRHG
jgi:hypothetical protein